MIRKSLPPVATPDARLLILGSMPGTRSLELQQYYAHPRNAFWPVLGTLLGFDPAMPYAARLAALTDRRIALWDVLQSCHRPGSLDAAIRVADAVPNDLAAFLAAHRHVERVLFNGSTAARLFERRVSADGVIAGRRLSLVTLPSTSPANAGLGLEAKRAAWRVLLGDCDEP